MSLSPLIWSFRYIRLLQFPGKSFQLDGVPNQIPAIEPMKNRRAFLKAIMRSLLFVPLGVGNVISPRPREFPYPEDAISEFCRRLEPVGRILETEGYYVWCNTPIYAPDGKVHVFYSRWREEYGMGGWIHKCEIAHAVADSPESDFRFVSVVLAPGAGFFDATTCHNPHIQYVDGKYCLFYMGNSNGKTSTKRIGLATSGSLYGPWERPSEPLLDVGESGAWDDHCTTNPAFLKHPDGRCWLYYKSWNTDEYEKARGKRIRGNRMYGVAIADKPAGPYVKYDGNPVIDFSTKGDNQQLEDAFVWYEDGKVKLIARDMGFFDHDAGLYFESPDGLAWGRPKIAYCGVSFYVEQPPAPPHLSRYGRLERPQLLMKDGKPQYLFTASQGGRYNTASGFVFRIDA